MQSFINKDTLEEVVRNTLEALHNEVLGDVGEHEWDNTWIEYNVIDLATNLYCANYTLLGYFWLQEPKPFLSGMPLDIGLVCEDVEGNRFWCHCSKKMIDEMIEEFFAWQREKFEGEENE